MVYLLGVKGDLVDCKELIIKVVIKIIYMLFIM